LTEAKETNRTQDWTDFLKTKYKRQLSEVSREYPHKRSLLIDYREVEKFGKVGIELADEMMDNPGKVLEDIWDAIASNQLIKSREGKVPKTNVRLDHFPRKTKIRDIRADDVGTAIAVEGMITRISEVRPRLVEAVFRCTAGHFTHKQQKFGRFSEPDKCGTDGCRISKSLDLIPVRSRFLDSQTGKISESLEGQRPGEQPQQLQIDIEDDLCGLLLPGERVILNGILRSMQRVIKGEKSTTFDLFLQVLSIERDQRNYGEFETTQEEEEEILRIAKTPDLLKTISQSILPAISGLEEEKKGIALHLFSPRQEISCTKRIRGSIHVFFGGDPGISKSTMLMMLKDITPRAIYISGKSTSSAGLTFTMRQDEFDKRWVADAGAAPMADESNLYVDELAQMEKGDIMSLNDFMESQIIPVQKAGISAILQARCATMVALNPKFGRFDMAGAPLADQIDSKIPPQLLSRFDLIYLVPDVPEATRDRKEAEEILGIWQGELATQDNQIPAALMQKYIAMAKRRKNPRMNDAAKKIIIDRFVEVRKMSGNGNVAVTKRALESLARLATAHAIMRFGDEVTIKDAEVAIEVYEYSLRQVCTDPGSGRPDADRVTGQTKEKRDLGAEICRVIQDQGGKAGMDVITREIKAKHPELIDNRIRSMIEQMYKENILMEAGLGKYRVV
jgi:replicative DNA helicase Mcm